MQPIFDQKFQILTSWFTNFDFILTDFILQNIQKFGYLTLGMI